MNHHVAVVGQDPLAGVPAFDADRASAPTLDPILYLFEDRSGLSLGSSGGDDEDLDDSEQLGYVKEENVAALLRVYGIGRNPGQIRSC